MPQLSVLDAPWAAYQTWSATSELLKKDLDQWRQRTLLLAIGGAILVAIGQQVTPIAPKEGMWAIISKGPTLLGSLAIALSAYFAREAVSGSRVMDWVRARATAEALKALTYLYRARVQPFDGADGPTKMLQRVDEIEKTVADLPTRLKKPESGDPDFTFLTVEDYIVKRVDDQIGYYDTKSEQYLLKNDRLRNITFGLGGISVVLGLSSVALPLANWVAVIATVTAALSAHALNQRYQTLTTMFQSTSRRLQLLNGGWIATGKKDSDTAERNAFIQSCENTLALENGAWLSQWSQKSSDAKSAGGGE